MVAVANWDGAIVGRELGKERRARATEHRRIRHEPTIERFLQFLVEVAIADVCVVCAEA